MSVEKMSSAIQSFKEPDSTVRLTPLTETAVQICLGSSCGKTWVRQTNSLFEIGDVPLQCFAVEGNQHLLIFYDSMTVKSELRLSQ